MARSANDEVKIGVDARNDGRYTVTIKLIGWRLNDLRGLAANLSLSIFARRMSGELGQAVEAAQKQREKEAAQ